MKFIKSLLLLSALLLQLTACQEVTNEEIPKKANTGKLFSKLSSNKTGVTFNNSITQNAKYSAMTYNYFLNGGGVAVGDFNNDQKPDLFFTANQKSDRLYINQGDFRFEEVSEKAGVEGWKNGGNKSWSTGVTTVDINNDGWLDLYICKSGPYSEAAIKQNLLYINNQDGTFSEKAKEYGINDTGFSTQSTFFDYDRDGDLDLYVMNHSYLFATGLNTYMEKSNDQEFLENVSGNLYQNNGNGTFNKITKQAGLLRHTYGLGCVAADLNHDGWIDLYTTSDYSSPDYLFINNQDGTFSDKIKEATSHISFYGMGCDVSDINNDGLVDIGVVDMTPADQLRSKTLMASMNTERFNELHDKAGFQYQYMINTLQLNHGNGEFSEVAQLTGFPKTDWSWNILMSDLDNDSWKDIFVTNGNRKDLMDNDFQIAFKKRSKELSGKFSDQEREEWLEKIPDHPLQNILLRNDGQLHFDRYNRKWGLEEKTFSNGAILSDLDGDGDLDMVINNIDEEAFIYQNNAESTEQNNYLQILLEGDGKNKMALNTKVSLYANGTQQYQELTLTRGYQSACDNILHFGLGKTNKIDSLVIHWLDGKKQVLQNVKINQKLSIKKEKTQASKYSLAGIYTPLFQEAGQELNLSFQHQENPYDDFKKELLLPHKNSQHGPHMAVADVNKDGLEDLFIGGAKDQAGALFLQNPNGTFRASNQATWSKDKSSEDINALFFDADQDGDQDLYVVSGGNEYPELHPALQDRLYFNDGKGNFSKNTSALPKITSSGSVVVDLDLDQDGDRDLFVGARMVPGRYPFAGKSYLLLNEGGKFKNVTNTAAPELKKPGMITTATVADIDGDQKEDLILSGEWMSIQIYKNTGGGLTDITPDELAKETGWWSSLAAGDFDKDGDLDFIAGNNGLNYKYKASAKEPFHIYGHDFDDNGQIDIVLGYFNQGICYPVRGRECSSQQMPFIKDKFPTYKAFASANINDVYGDKLKDAHHLTVSNFASSFIRNNGNGQFSVEALPREAQFSCINGIVVDDFNGDGNLDFAGAGNLFVSEVETPRNDAGKGICLLGNGDGTFRALNALESGIFAPGDVKDLKAINIKGKGKSIVVANNDAAVQVFVLK